MKPTVLQVLFVIFSYSEFISAVRHSDPFEEFLMRERQLQEEYERQQEELRMRFEEQQEQQRLLLQDVTDNGSELPPTATATEMSTDIIDASTFATTTSPDSEQTATVSPRRQSTCCSLGEKAARSGFLCTPEHYRPQFFLNHDLYRQNNFKISRSQREQFVEQRQFTKCVSGAVPSLSDEFQRCCKQAYVETLDEEVVGVSRDGEDVDMPIMLELPLQIDIISKQRRRPRTHHKAHVKV